MARKTNLAQALNLAVGRVSEGSPVGAPEGTGGPARVSGKNQVPPSRVGLKTIAGHFDPAVSKQLRALALERDVSLQALLREAINDLFEKYHRAPLA